MASEQVDTVIMNQFILNIYEIVNVQLFIHSRLFLQDLCQYVMDIRTRMGEVYSAQDKLSLLTSLVTRLEEEGLGVRGALARLATLITATSWVTAGLEADTVWGLIAPSLLDARLEQ